MNRFLGVSFSAVVLLLPWVFSPPPSGAATLSVRPDGSGEYPTIRAAITAAQPRDTVLLEDGTFRGSDNHNLQFLRKPLVIRSRAGDPAQCIIDCAMDRRSAERAFLFGAGDTAVVQGLTMTNGTCLGTSEDRSGAGVRCEYVNQVQIDNCVFSYNTAMQGGGAAVGPYSSPVFTHCVFDANSCAEDGAGISTWGDARPTLVGCTFRNNSCSLDGGAVEVFDGEPHFLDCDFVGNNSDWFGGCISTGGHALFTRCAFHESTAMQGGVIHNERDALTEFDECVFYDNSPNYAAVAYTEAELIFRNCTLYRNNAYDGAIRSEPIAYTTMDHTIVAFQTRGVPIWCPAGTATVTCCDFFGNAGGDWRYCIQDQYDGVRNISVDPLFCDPEQGDFHLRPESPLANNLYCGLIGALPVGCSSSEVAENGPVPGRPRVWITPNPAPAGCSISWQLPSAGPASIQIFNVTGRRVRSIAGLPAAAGATSWDELDDGGRPVPAGAYLVRLSSAEPGAATLGFARVVLTR
jgi:hypothetical protein